MRTVRLTNAEFVGDRCGSSVTRTLVMNESGAWHRDRPFNALHVETRFCKPLKRTDRPQRVAVAAGRTGFARGRFPCRCAGPWNRGHGVRGFHRAVEPPTRRVAPCAPRPRRVAQHVQSVRGTRRRPDARTAREHRHPVSGRPCTLRRGSPGYPRPRLRFGDACRSAEPEPRVLPVDARAAFHRFTQEGHLVTAGVRARPVGARDGELAGYGVVADSAGYVASFSANARHHTLTPFRFEGFPASAPGQVVAIRDLDTGDTACLLPLAGTPRSSFAPATATLNGEAAGIAFATEIRGALRCARRGRRLTLRDTAGRARRLRLSLHMTMVLAEFPAESAGHLLAEEDPASGALLFRNPHNPSPRASPSWRVTSTTRGGRPATRASWGRGHDDARDVLTGEARCRSPRRLAGVLPRSSAISQSRRTGKVKSSSSWVT